MFTLWMIWPDACRGGANKRQLENLVKAGAFDSLHENRREIFEALDQLLGQSIFIAVKPNPRNPACLVQIARMLHRLFVLQPGRTGHNPIA